MAPQGRILVIAEKPSVARDIARAMGRFSKGDGCLESPEMIVSWAVGHLLELAEPEDYEPRWKRWSMETLPILPPEFRLRPIPKTKPQFDVLVSLLERPDVVKVINACDAGREGELIFRYIYETAGCAKPVERLWVSSLTEEAISEGFASLRPAAEYDNLFAAARCRNEADWLVGINGSRGLTKKAGLLLAVGRVQTPTLAMIVQREKEIRAFQPRDFWQVFATFRGEAGEWRGIWDGGSRDAKGNRTGSAEDRQRLWSEEEAKSIAQRVAGRHGTVAEVETKRRHFPPPLLYDLNELQREMNRRRGFSAAKTLSLAQELYERDKALTYPRTDSRHLPPDLIPRFPSMLRAAGTATGLGNHVETVLAKPKLPISGRFVDAKKVSDHHALVPTPKEVDPNQWSDDKRQVYEAVCRRFIAAFFPAAVDDLTSVTTVVESEPFFSQGRQVVDPGWHVIEKPTFDADLPVLPELKEGDPARTLDAKVEHGQTKPPARFTEASLLQAMETAGKLIDDEELREMMKGEGIGTPATRAAIIERLLDLSYIVRERRSLVPTEKGIFLIERIPVPVLTSPSLTGQWERKLREIEAGKMARQAFMAETAEFTRTLTDAIREMSGDTEEAAMAAVLPPCPLCGSRVTEGPRFYYCTRRGEGCAFLVGKVIAGRRISPNDVQALIEKRQTSVLRGFRSKNNRPFSARLVLSDDGRVVFSFPERRRPEVRRNATKESAAGYDGAGAPGSKPAAKPAARSAGPKKGRTSRSGTQDS